MLKFFNFLRGKAVSASQSFQIIEEQRAPLSAEQQEQLERLIEECRHDLTQCYQPIEILNGVYPQLKEDQAVEPLDDGFICMMCTEVVCEPKACQNCARLFCTSCIGEWAERNAECPCPNCQQHFEA